MASVAGSPPKRMFEVRKFVSRYYSGGEEIENLAREALLRMAAKAKSSESFQSQVNCLDNFQTDFQKCWYEAVITDLDRRTRTHH